VFAFDVLGERGFLFELPVADVTLVRFLICVRQLVPAKVVRAGKLLVAGFTDVQSDFFSFHFGLFLLAVQQVFAQVSLSREGHVAEATLCNGLLLVLIVTAHFTDVFLKVRESSKQTAALITLERPQVIMASPDMHGDCGVVPERHATPVADIRLFTRMDPLMYIQLMKPAEESATVFTLELLDICVDL